MLTKKLASFIAKESQAKLIIARWWKELGIEDFIGMRQVLPTGVYNFTYIPRSLLHSGDNVSIVDDIVRSESIIEALVKACHMANAMVKGVYVISTVRQGIKSLERTTEFLLKLFWR